MSEDRTQAPSKRRRDEARARGVVARSPELVASVGLLAAVTLLGVWGESLINGLIDLVRAPYLAAPGADPSAMIRASALRVATPLIGLLVGVVAAMVAAHQAQVGALWAPALLAPDPSRLWHPSGPDWSARAARGAWGIAKAAVVVAVVAWAIRSEARSLSALPRMEVGALARSCGSLLKSLAYTLGLALLALGLLDFWLAHRRVESMLQVSPDQHREEQKAVDGDPSVRSRRQRMARSWRADPSEILVGSSLLVTGPGGLSVVLGGPGPRARSRSAAWRAGPRGRCSADRPSVPASPSPTIRPSPATSPGRRRGRCPCRRRCGATWPRSGRHRPRPDPPESPGPPTAADRSAK